MAVNETRRRRIIPPAYREATLRMTGEAPLLMHADTLLDPLHPLTRELRPYLTKMAKNRTVDDIMSIMRLEWLAGIYHDDELGPYIPGVNVKAALATAGKRFNKGETIKKYLVVMEKRIPLEYDGPRGQDELWEEGFRDVRGVVNSGRNKGRVSRCRPCFEDWALSATISYDPQQLDRDVLEDVVEYAQICGFGDGRPDFGIFAGEWTEADKSHRIAIWCCCVTGSLSGLAGCVDRWSRWRWRLVDAVGGAVGSERSRRATTTHSRRIGT